MNLRMSDIEEVVFWFDEASNEQGRFHSMYRKERFGFSVTLVS